MRAGDDLPLPKLPRELVERTIGGEQHVLLHLRRAQEGRKARQRRPAEGNQPLAVLPDEVFTGAVECVEEFYTPQAN